MVTSKVLFIRVLMSLQFIIEEAVDPFRGVRETTVGLRLTPRDTGLGVLRPVETSDTGTVEGDARL